jgi:nucleoside-diphosphate-sugar epimerase
MPALLARGYEVHAVTSGLNVPDGLSPDVHWHRADLLDKDQGSAIVALVKPTHLLHSAWYAAPGKYWTAKENFLWVEASLKLLKAFCSHGGQRVIGVGSCAEYDWQEGICSERTTRPAPATVYGSCKQACQLLFSAYSKQAGVSAAWGRLFFLYGPHEPHERLVPSVILSLLQGVPALCTHGRQIRDFLFVSDAADALVALLDSAVEGPVNIASGKAISVADVVREIATQVQRPDLVRMGARETPGGEPGKLWADVARLTGEVGWSPRYDLAQGIAETIQWWKSQTQNQKANL